MAKTSMKVKQQRPAKFSTREYTRCKICGRPHSVLRKYGICRVCFRELAYKGQIPGVKKASWQTESNLVKTRISVVEVVGFHRLHLKDVTIKAKNKEATSNDYE